MTGSSKPSLTSKRHAQLVSSSSHRFDSRSKHDLTVKGAVGSELAPKGIGQPDSTRRTNGTGTGDGIGPHAGKLTVSRRTYSSIAPQASPRVHRTDSSEKENVVVEDTSLRQTICHSATSTTLRKTPVPTGNVKVKIPHPLPRSESFRPAQLPRSSNSNAHLRPAATTHRRTMTKSRTTFSLGVGATGKNDVNSLERRGVSGKRFLASAPVSFGSECNSLSHESATVQSLELVVNLDSNSCQVSCNQPGALMTPCSPQSVCGPPNFDISDSAPCLPSAVVSTPIRARIGGQPVAGFGHLTTPSPIGNLCDLGAEKAAMKTIDSDSTKVPDDENSFDLTDLKAVFQQVKAELKEASPTSSPKTDERASIILEEASRVAISGTTGDVCAAVTSNETQTIRTLHSGDEDADGKILEAKIASEDESKVLDPADVEASRSMSSLLSKSKQTAELGGSDCDSCFSGFLASDTANGFSATTNATVENATGPEPPSTPKSSILKTPSHTVPCTPPSTPIFSSPTGSMAQLPSTLFPRVFVELASSYAHLGFNSSSGSSCGLGSVTDASAGLNEQTVRTQRELARLRACAQAGKGSVLARARVFGQTLWSPSRGQRVGVSSGVDLKSSEVGEIDESAIQLTTSDSVSASPSSPTPSPRSPTKIQVPIGPIGRRTLGCTDPMHAVTMAQQLWKTKNFMLK